MSDDDVRSFKLSYPRGTAIPFWIDLCQPCQGKRLAAGASVLEKRRPVTASACADCDPKGALR